MPSALLKILPPTTIGILGSSTSFTVTSSAPGVFLSVLPNKCLPPTILRFLKQPYKLHHTLFSPRIVPFCPPEELLASNYGYGFNEFI
ncbi:hypothetical protein A2U01_0074430, partial [Trifolium medium]|nr:hypothetical protein [Trifolium medium]